MPPIKSGKRNPTSGRGTKKNTSKTPQNNSSKQKTQRRSNAGNARRNQGDSFNNPTQAASAYASGVDVRKPKITMSNGMCNVRHREFLGNVSGTSTFTQSLSLALNPGIAATFPWLANMAQNWQAYRFKRLRFCYYTRTGSNIPGSVILCPDYNAQDAAPVSEQVIDSYEDAKEDAPWKNIECNLNAVAMHLMGPKKYIRLGALAANQDLKTFDVGNMYVYTVDGTAVNWGKVWVEYDVDLFTPQLPPGGSSFTQTALIVGATSQTAAEPLGTAPVVTGNMQVVAGNNSTNSTLVLSNAIVGGEYALSIYITGTGITQSVIESAVTGATLKSGGNQAFSVAATTGFYIATFTATASTITWVLSGTATTITGCNVLLALIPTSSF